MPGEEEPRKATGFLKCCLLAGCAVFLLTGVLGVFAYGEGKKLFDPVHVEALAKDIVPCEIPPGYAGSFQWPFFGIKMIMIFPKSLSQASGTAGGIPLMIMMPAPPQKQPADALKVQMQAQLASRGQSVQTAAAEQEVVTIRGKETKIERAVGKDKNGASLVQYLIILEQEPTATNPAGQEIIVLMGGEKTFDRKSMDSFLGSIK